MSKIEQSNTRGRFTPAEAREMVKESKKFWASPAGQAEKRRLDERQRRAKGRGTKFPELAKRTGTRPAAVTGTRPAVTGNDEILFHNII